MAGEFPTYPSDCQVVHGLLERADARDACLAKARRIKVLLLDVDGILTDGKITYTADGQETKSFHTRDGFGIKLLRRAGIEVGLISARGSQALSRRAADLSLHLVFQNIENKLQAFEAALASVGCRPDQAAYMGDDWLDLMVLSRAGFAATVPDAAPEVREIAHYITRCPAGSGAVREVCDLILEARDLRLNLLASYR